MQKYRVSMFFVRSPAPNRSVKEFAVELSLCISIFIGIPRSWYIDLKISPTRPSFHHCVELRFSNAQGCLKSGSRFHSVIASLSHQSLSCFFSRLDPAAKSLSTKTDFVNAFLVFDISTQIWISQPDIALRVSSE